MDSTRDRQVSLDVGGLEAQVDALASITAWNGEVNHENRLRTGCVGVHVLECSVHHYQRWSLPEALS